MTKQERKELEALSLELTANRNKNYYRHIEKKGLLYREAGTNNVAKLSLNFTGIKTYLEKTIKARKDFIAGQEVLKTPEVVNEQ